MIHVPRIPRTKNDEIVVILNSAIFSKKKDPCTGEAATGNATAKKCPGVFSFLGNVTTQGNQKLSCGFRIGITKWA